jgi:hypothetical protein
LKRSGEFFDRVAGEVGRARVQEWWRLVDLGEPPDYSAPERLVNRLGLQFLRDSILRTSSLCGRSSGAPGTVRNSAK